MGAQSPVNVPSLPTELYLGNYIIDTLVSLLLQIQHSGGILDEDAREPNEIEVHVYLQVA